MNGYLPWVLFHIFIIFLLILDLGVFNKKSHVITIKESLLLSAFYIILALFFNVLIYFTRGRADALNFLSGYLIEKSLSVDNLFVFVLIFSYFKIPEIYRHNILFWGIIGAFIMRAFFILGGITLIHHFEWILYIFGFFLVYTGIKMAFAKSKEVHPEQHPIFKFLLKYIPYTNEISSDRFFVVKEGKRYATPLFLALLAVEVTDVVFAIDSIPAIFAITLDPYIVYTSNIFAILGLRALFFALSGLMMLFEFLHYGLAAILTFVGFKLLFADFIHIRPVYALLVIGFLLTFSIGLSIWKAKKNISR